MGTQAAVDELIAERSRIDQALVALTGKKPAGPVPPTPRTTSKPAASASSGGKRTFKMSDEAKKKIAAAQRARWEKIRKGMTGKGKAA